MMIPIESLSDKIEKLPYVVIGIALGYLLAEIRRQIRAQHQAPDAENARALGRPPHE
jgi:hypothetical protein